MNRKISLMLLQSNELFRKSLIALFKTQTDLEIAGESSNGKELLRHLKQKYADIVLLDLDTSLMDAKAMLNILQIRFPKTKVMLLSSKPAVHHTSEFMSRGANCFLTTDCGVDVLFSAIHAVCKEGYYFDAAVSKAMLEALKNRQLSTDVKEALFTDRETEIIRAVCDGKTNKEIAQILHISASTVDFYKAKIYEKTNCNTAAGLIKYAVKRGIFEIV